MNAIEAKSQKKCEDAWSLGDGSSSAFYLLPSGS